MIISIPQDVKTFELSSSFVWLDRDGILYSVPKENSVPEHTQEAIRKEIDILKNISGHKKVCVISESNTRSPAPPKNMRDFIAEQLNSFVKAFAIVSSSPLNRMVVSLFFSFKPPPYPFKMFSNEKEAREWIKQYL